MNPYDILNVPIVADDETIRKSYLKLVKKFPPGSAPEQFKKINAAYLTLKDEKGRLEYYLFNTDMCADAPAEILLDFLRAHDERKVLSLESMKKYLKSCCDG